MSVKYLNEIEGERLVLKFTKFVPGIPEKQYVDCCLYDICLKDGTVVGTINAKLGFNESVFFIGNTQLEKSGKQERLQYAFHQAILEDKLPLSIGGGIGQSRLCMLLLGRAHIGEVQASYWDKTTMQQCEQQDIELL